MNKQELIATVAERTELPRQQIADIVAAVLDTVQETLADGDQVALTGFGTFKTREKPARSGYSALAGRTVDTPAKTVAVFKAGSSLAAAVNTTTAQAA
jgi:nucleoid DNA-binding protein